MSQARRYAGNEARLEAAADWVVRLQAAELDLSDALAFDAWLQAAPDNARAYDQALAVWLAYGRHAGEVAGALAARAAVRPDRRRLWFAAGAAAVAATVAVAVLPEIGSRPATQLYATGVGEHRTVRLADGSTVDLDAATRLSVTLDRSGRHVALAEGEAVFDVAHDARRPFLIAAGDRTVRVVGTQFDVRRRDGRLSVTVARGAVEVRPAAGVQGAAYRLHPGQRLDHREGAPDVRIAPVDAGEVLGWRSGRLVYRDQPLGDVVADLNRQFATPIRIDDPDLASLPISGVLVLDDQEAVIRRLALLVPIRAVRSDAGLILRRDSAAGS
ncbi:FecR family protein [Phenylobacterium sp.]|uniref:FecR family protein n=1 Tax=Phenylobacterium sp. TaxID=1871053 RepID=UPI00391BCA01